MRAASDEEMRERDKETRGPSAGDSPAYGVFRLKGEREKKPRARELIGKHKCPRERETLDVADASIAHTFASLSVCATRITILEFIYKYDMFFFNIKKFIFIIVTTNLFEIVYKLKQITLKVYKKISEFLLTYSIKN